MSALELNAARIAYRALTVAAETTIGEGAPQAALYLLVTGANVPGALAARVYGSSKQYVSKALRQVEDRREDPKFDQAMAALEQRLFNPS
jgi:hypothetical protein